MLVPIYFSSSSGHLVTFFPSSEDSRLKSYRVETHRPLPGIEIGDIGK